MTGDATVQSSHPRGLVVSPKRKAAQSEEDLRITRELCSLTIFYERLMDTPHYP